MDQTNSITTFRRNGATKLHSHSDAISYFKKNDRTKIYDLQVFRPLSLSWNCDGTRLGAGAEKSVAVVTVDSSCRTKTLFRGFGHSEQVDHVNFHPSSPYTLASASSDRTIRLWDIRQTRTHTRLTTKAQNLNVAWSPCATYFVYGDRDDTLNLVDGRCLKTVKTECLKSETNEFVFDRSGKYLFVALGGGQVRIISMPEMVTVRTIQAHSPQSTCTCIAMSRDGKHVAVGASDAICSVWLSNDLICEYNIGRLDYPIRSVSFSADNQLIAAASEDHFIDIAWAKDGKRVYELNVNAENYTCAWHPSVFLLAYASASPVDSRERDVTVRVFGLTT